jgi:hypothetical protein
MKIPIFVEFAIYGGEVKVKKCFEGTYLLSYFSVSPRRPLGILVRTTGAVVSGRPRD